VPSTICKTYFTGTDTDTVASGYAISRVTCVCHVQAPWRGAQYGAEAFAFSRHLLFESFLCLFARFEELCAQAFNELQVEGVIEQISSVVERLRYDHATAEKKKKKSFLCCRRYRLQTLHAKLHCYCQGQIIPCSFLCPSMLSQEPLKVSAFLIWHSTASESSELPLHKTCLVECHCPFSTRAWPPSFRVLQSAIIIMLSKIKRLLKVLHSSCTRVIKLELEAAFRVDP
jgi:hypothetical protein